MARAMVVLARRFVKSCCCCSLFPRAFFSAAASVAPLSADSCVPVCASSFARWAAARASVTLTRRAGVPFPPVVTLSFGSFVVIVVASFWLLISLEASKRGYGSRQDVASSPRQGVTSQRRQDVTAQKAGCRVLARAGCRPKTRQDVAVRLFTQHKTAFCFPYQRLVATRRLVIGLQRDGLFKRAGDGTRTRDSLLGRQSRIKSPLAYHKLAQEAS